MKQVFFIHVPKTAGLYIHYGLYGNENYHYRGHSFYDPVGILDWQTWNYYRYKNDIQARVNSNYIDNYSISSTWGYSDLLASHRNNIVFFTCIRNPFNILVSYYHYHMMDGWAGCNVIHNIRCFEDFVYKYCDDDFPWHCKDLQKNIFAQLYDREGCIVPTEIIRYENLQQDLAKFTEKYDLKFDARNSIINPTERRVDVDYRTCYNQDMVSKLNKKWESVLKEFDYAY